MTLWLMKISTGQCQYHLISSRHLLRSHRPVSHWLHYIQVCFFRNFSFAFSHFSYFFHFSSYILPTFFYEFLFCLLAAFNLLVFRSNFHTFSVAFTPPSHLTFHKSVYLHIPLVLSSYLCTMIQLLPTCIYLQKRLSSVTARCPDQQQKFTKKNPL